MKAIVKYYKGKEMRHEKEIERKDLGKMTLSDIVEEMSLNRALIYREDKLEIIFEDLK